MSADKHKGVTRRKFIVSNCMGIVVTNLQRRKIFMDVPGRHAAANRFSYYPSEMNVTQDIKKLIKTGKVFLFRSGRKPKKFGINKYSCRVGRTTLQTEAIPEFEPRMIPRGQPRPKVFKQNRKSKESEQRE